MLAEDALTPQEEAWHKQLLGCLASVPNSVIGLHRVVSEGPKFDFSRTLDNNKVLYATYPDSVVSIDFQDIFTKHSVGIPQYAASQTHFARDTAALIQTVVAVWQEILSEVYQRHFDDDGQPRKWFKSVIDQYLTQKAEEADEDIALDALWADVEFRSMLLRMIILSVPTYLSGICDFFLSAEVRRLIDYTYNEFFQHCLGLPLFKGFVQANSVSVSKYAAKLDSNFIFWTFHDGALQNAQNGGFDSIKHPYEFMEQDHAKLPQSMHDLLNAADNFQDGYLIRDAILNIHYVYKRAKRASKKDKIQQIESYLSALNSVLLFDDLDPEYFGKLVDFIGRLVRCGQSLSRDI